jgi:hypothetical protein
MSGGFTEGDLIAYVGTDEPGHFLHEGSPGVVIDVGPTPHDISVDLDFGPAFSTSALELARIDQTEFRERADRMKRGLHPLRDEPIAPFDPFGSAQGS